MIGSVVESPGALLAGLGIVVLGYLIKYREWTVLVASYDASSDVPKTVAADVVGGMAIRVGVATAVFGVIAAVVSIPEVAVLAFAVVVGFGAVRAVYRLRTYQPAAT